MLNIHNPEPWRLVRKRHFLLHALGWTYHYCYRKDSTDLSSFLAIITTDFVVRMICMAKDECDNASLDLMLVKFSQLMLLLQNLLKFQVNGFPGIIESIVREQRQAEDKFSEEGGQDAVGFDRDDDDCKMSQYAESR